MLNFDAFKKADLQNCRAILVASMASGLNNIPDLDAAILQLLSGVDPNIKATFRRRPDNITKCSQCGSTAIIVPLNDPKKPGTRTDNKHTHAIQCQNRPQTNNSWDSEHCGFTDYVVIKNG